MPIPLTKREFEYTYKDYCNWPDDQRWELINGIAYDMTPAPSRTHQKISVVPAKQCGSIISIGCIS